MIKEVYKKRLWEIRDAQWADTEMAEMKTFFRAEKRLSEG